MPACLLQSCAVGTAGNALGQTLGFAPFYAWGESDAFGRLVVFVLFLASIGAWTIIVDKWMYLRRLRQVLRTARAKLQQHGPGLAAKTDELQGATREITAAVAAAGNVPAAASEAVAAGLQRRRRVQAEAAVDREIMVLESRLGLLSSLVSASPFLGLLGTVWGVMVAFCGMASQGEANIGAIAPGVSAALLTTVVGLIVAIPAVIGYNVLVNEVKVLSVELDNFADDLLSRMDPALTPGPQED